VACVFIPCNFEKNIGDSVLDISFQNPILKYKIGLVRRGGQRIVR
jgi:hypothetical protein